jgi:hypothetical protein
VERCGTCEAEDLDVCNPRIASGPVWHCLNAGVFRRLLKLALEAGIFAFGK